MYINSHYVLQLQEISPGFVYTEIIQRAFKCDNDTAKNIYDQIIPEVKFNMNN